MPNCGRYFFALFKNMRYLFFLIIIFLSLSLQAQSQFPDLVHLQNGSILRCRILEYKPDDIIKIEIQGGSVLVYKAAEVLKIDRNAIMASAVKEEKEKIRHIYNDELYFSAFMNILGGYKEVPSWWGGLRISQLWVLGLNLVAERQLTDI
jgi:hypothetical protein